MNRIAVLAVTVICALLLAAPAVAGAARPGPPGKLTVVTVPPMAGARVSAEGRIAITNKHGRATLDVQNWTKINGRFHVLTTRINHDTRVEKDRVVGTPSSGRGGQPLQVGLAVKRLISIDFADRGGQGVDTGRVSQLEMRSNTGEVLRLSTEDLRHPFWVNASRNQMTPEGLVSKDIYWRITVVTVDGAQAVNSSQQVFYPNKNQSWTVSLLFYRITLGGSDLLFGTDAGGGVLLKLPDGSTQQKDFGPGGVVTFDALPRGSYYVTVYGAGMTIARPMSISKDQAVDVEVISYLDMYVVAGVMIFLMLSLVMVGRRQRIGTMVRWIKTHLRRPLGVATVLLALVVLCSGLVQRPVAAEAAPTTGSVNVPAYAYFYIWYQPTSWLRAKNDTPLLGNYSSDDDVIMRQQVEMAKAAGLTGFIVSWKRTTSLDSRLETLVRIATEEHFELAVVYEGLTHDRRTLPPRIIGGDLRWLSANFGHAAPFQRFGRPVVALTGSEQYSRRQINKILSVAGPGIDLLATAKSNQDYARIADLVDGNAYYWSSANPTASWYPDKLITMGDAVHARGGLWFAPAASAFDARMIGGTQVIPRNNGATLKTAVAAAMQSKPDILSIISWNEFSENSFVEPSQELGTAPLAAVASILGGHVQVPSSLTGSPAKHSRGLTGWGALVFILLLVGVINLFALRRRAEVDSRHGSDAPKAAASAPR